MAPHAPRRPARSAHTRRPRLVLLLVALLLPLAASAGDGAEDDIGRHPTEVAFDWGVSIPVADGTRLNGTLYRPIDHEGRRLATIVTVTPYISDRYHPDAQYFARHGYAFLVVDTRGRGNSEGNFRPLDLEDGEDGRDIVEWIARQPWSNGRVGMRGGSYGGYNQWVTARYFPEHLTTIVPIAAPYHGVDFPMNDSVQYPYTIRWLTLTAGNAAQGRIFGDSGFWARKFLAYHRSGKAFAALDTLVGLPSDRFREWVSHPMMDAHWRARVPSPDELARLDLPILTITGYYDGDQPGAMAYYHEHMRHGSDAATRDHYLLLGPWDHGGTRFPRQEFGGLAFGDAMMFDAFALDREWYDWTMGDGERPAFLRDRVTYYVAGANRWKSAASLDAVADDTMVLTLGADRPRHTLFRSGVMRDGDPGTGAPASVYIYDPLDTAKAEREAAAAATGGEIYIVDQAEVVATDGDGLVFHSAPFAEATEIAGYPRFEAWLETDVPDTDVKVTLYEVLADGSSIALADQTLRLRHREGFDREVMMRPGEPERVVFERFHWFARQVAAGSRLRLFVRPANGLMMQRHYNGAGTVHDQTAADARTATVRLLHDAGHRSRLELPVVSENR